METFLLFLAIFPTTMWHQHSSQQWQTSDLLSYFNVFFEVRFLCDPNQTHACPFQAPSRTNAHTIKLHGPESCLKNLKFLKYPGIPLHFMQSEDSLTSAYTKLDQWYIITSQMIPVHSLPSYFSTIHFNIILPLKPVTSCVLFASRFPRSQVT